MCIVKWKAMHSSKFTIYFLHKQVRKPFAEQRHVLVYRNGILRETNRTYSARSPNILYKYSIIEQLSLCVLIFENPMVPTRQEWHAPSISPEYFFPCLFEYKNKKRLRNKRMRKDFTICHRHRTNSQCGRCLFF